MSKGTEERVSKETNRQSNKKMNGWTDERKNKQKNEFREMNQQNCDIKSIMDGLTNR